MNHCGGGRGKEWKEFVREENGTLGITSGCEATDWCMLLLGNWLQEFNKYINIYL
jgi:hypothetical protein